MSNFKVGDCVFDPRCPDQEGKICNFQGAIGPKRYWLVERLDGSYFASCESDLCLTEPEPIQADDESAESTEEFKVGDRVKCRWLDGEPWGAIEEMLPNGMALIRACGGYVKWSSDSLDKLVEESINEPPVDAEITETEEVPESPPSPRILTSFLDSSDLSYQIIRYVEGGWRPTQIIPSRIAKRRTSKKKSIEEVLEWLVVFTEVR